MPTFRTYKSTDISNLQHPDAILLRKSNLPSKVCFSIPNGNEPLHGCWHLLFTSLHVLVISVMEVRVIVNEPIVDVELPLMHETVRLVGAVELLPQFSEVPHLGF
jgi:hypothetical protein